MSDPKDYTDGIAHPYQWIEEEEHLVNKEVPIEKEIENKVEQKQSELPKGTIIKRGRKDILGDWI